MEPASSFNGPARADRKSAVSKFSDAFSATFGVLGFYGGAEKNRIPQYPLALFDTQTSFSARTRYEGLSAISERDELFLSLRYTF